MTSADAPVRHGVGRFCVPPITNRERILFMRCFWFPSTVRFWVAIWIVILLFGLMPLPPAVESIIVVAFLTHSVWFVQRRLRRAAAKRALAGADRAEEAEYRTTTTPTAVAGVGLSLRDCGTNYVAPSVAHDGEATVFPSLAPPLVTSQRTVSDLLGSGTNRVHVTYSQPPAEQPSSRITRSAMLRWRTYS
jgi:hypothetical protein